MSNQNEMSASLADNSEDINRECDKLITELKSIKWRVAALQHKTSYCGPSIDAERQIELAIKRLAHQKR